MKGETTRRLRSKKLGASKVELVIPPTSTSSGTAIRNPVTRSGTRPSRRDNRRVATTTVAHSRMAYTPRSPNVYCSEDFRTATYQSRSLGYQLLPSETRE